MIEKMRVLNQFDLSSVGLWVHWHELDSAGTKATCDCDSDVSFFSVGFTPRVLDNVVLETGFISTISDNKDSMVSWNSATVLGDDTSGILMEDWMISSEGN